MQAMNHPNYKRTYWTPERRKAASDAAKARWVEKRARETAQWEDQRLQRERERMGLLGQIREKRREALERKERARQAYWAADNQANELQAADDAIAGTLRVLRRHGLSGNVG